MRRGGAGAGSGWLAGMARVRYGACCLSSARTDLQFPFHVHPMQAAGRGTARLINEKMCKRIR